ncbi:MAG TPA: substrate-binding domain-containing protein [Streptosporangiaceae bacterium]|jgi:ABC-type phosphate transport system substrate-binding protein|nr:substrate-binding domain-containing protein [Streptosporangiaceae bacterium]
MRMLSKVLAGSAAMATLVSVGLASSAQAQVTKPHTAVRATLTVKPSKVPAGLVTAVNVSNPCATGTKPSSVTGFPAPNGTTTNLQAILPQAPKAIRIAGVWPPTPPTSYTITVKCSSGPATSTGTVTVQSGPQPASVVGVGSDTIQNVMDQFSADYNTSKNSASLYSWDATNPVTGAQGDSIATKQGCAAIPRPDGSSAGITALTTENGSTSGHPCIDFARSSRARGSGDPTSITFVTLAGDAVTYATQPGTNAPGNLTTADLTGIYNCTITQWNQIPGNSGGSSATIAAMLPQNGSGTRSFFLSAIGLTAPGPCVSTSATQQGSGGANDNTLQENEGVAPSLNTNTANVIFPFSVGKYLAERYHSASCGSISQCFASPNKCAPNAKQNLFGCNERGTMNLNMINGTNPTVPFPLTNSTTGAVTNSAFTPTFTRFLYEVVNQPEFGIPSYLQPYFSSTGWVCTNSTAKTDLKNYGFIVLPAGTAAGDCGSLS